MPTLFCRIICTSSPHVLALLEIFIGIPSKAAQMASVWENVEKTAARLFGVMMLCSDQGRTHCHTKPVEILKQGVEDATRNKGHRY